MSVRRPPVVNIPTLSPVVGVSVSRLEEEPQTVTKTAPRSRSPVSISNRKPWGANSSSPRTLPKASEKVTSRSSSAEMRRPSVPFSCGTTESTKTSHEVVRRLEAIENENKQLRGLVTGLVQELSLLRRTIIESDRRHESSIAGLESKTSYVVNWVDHFNRVVEEAESSRKEGTPNDNYSIGDDGSVARALDMEV